MTNLEKLAINLALTHHEIDRNTTELNTGKMSISQTRDCLNRIGVLKEKMTDFKGQVFDEIETLQIELPADLDPGVMAVDSSEEHY